MVRVGRSFNRRASAPGNDCSHPLRILFSSIVYTSAGSRRRETAQGDGAGTTRRRGFLWCEWLHKQAQPRLNSFLLHRVEFFIQGSATLRAGGAENGCVALHRVAHGYSKMLSKHDATTAPPHTKPSDYWSIGRKHFFNRTHLLTSQVQSVSRANGRPARLAARGRRADVCLGGCLS